MGYSKYLLGVIIALLSISLITVTPMRTVIGIENNENTKPLYNITHWEIPDNLPWYPIVVIGDNRPDDTNAVKPPAIFYTIINEASKIYPVALIGTGDHVGKGTYEQYMELYRILNSSHIPNIWLAIGNHDIELHQESMNYWKEFIGPEHFYIDDIPGWRIAVINSETRLSRYWKQEILEAYNNLDNRSLILVFHRPVYPKVQHNLDTERSSMLLKIINEKDHVKLVLQGHYHGWGMQVKNNITWIITGGAGAPLYSYAKEVFRKDLQIINHKYHYVILILYPNQTFTYTPILAGSGSGILSIKKINSTTYKVVNTKKTIYNTPAEIPIRIKYVLTINSTRKTLYIQLMTPYGKPVYVSVFNTSRGYIVKANTTNWYAYIYNDNNPEKALVYKPVNNNVKIISIKKTNTTIPTTLTSQTTTTTQITQTTTTTTTTSTTTSTTTTITTTATKPTSKATGQSNYVIYAIVGIIVLIIAVLGYIFLKK